MDFSHYTLIRPTRALMDDLARGSLKKQKTKKQKNCDFYFILYFLRNFFLYCVCDFAKTNKNKKNAQKAQPRRNKKQKQKQNKTKQNSKYGMKRKSRNL